MPGGTFLLCAALLALAAVLCSATSVNLVVGPNFNLLQDADGSLFLHYDKNNGDKIFLGVNLDAELLSSAIYEHADGGGVRVNFGPNTKLEVTAAGECSNVQWTTSELPEIKDCVNYGDSNWFGAFEQKNQQWPMEKLVKSNYAYVTKELDNMAIAERYFLNSKGDYIYISDYVPLFLDLNATGQNDMCFTAKIEQPFQPVPELRLHYQICSYGFPHVAQDAAIRDHLGRPTEIPDPRMVEFPIWSTWVRYKRDINQTIVLAFAEEIASKGYSQSQFEIDDFWETCYGELEFDYTKFPDPAAMVAQIKAMGFRVTLWIHPFMNANCPSFDAARQAGYFAKDEQGNVRTTWWNGLNAAIVDFTNQEASEWFLNKVRAIQQLTQLDSFKFDAGETSWMPKPRVLNAPNEIQPNIYSTNFVNYLAEFGPLTEVRTGFQTQTVPMFVRMVDKDSRWTMNNGLRSIVTTLLAMNLAGYPYVLPDMIGGNAYFGEQIDKLLFVRWLQASTFMPAIQFSYVPWDFGDPVIEQICDKFIQLHANYTQTIMDAALNYQQGSHVSVNNPIWMPRFLGDQLIDPIALTIDDEYLLGDSILVAPVMDQGAVMRDIYLPTGNFWEDMNTGLIYEGGTWLYNYPAPLDTLPYFKVFIMSSAPTATAGFLFVLVAAMLATVFV